MKKLLIALLFSPMLSLASPTEMCIAQHLETAANNPGMNYEKDEGVLKIWCQCKRDRELLGLDEYQTLEYCTANTNDAINQHLKMGRYSK